MKQEKGVTMIMMVVTIVMMILIAGFSIYNSKDTIIETKLAKIYNEIKEVKTGVIRYKVLYEDGMEVIADDKLSSLAAYPAISTREKPDQEYYLLDFVNKSNVLNDIFELRNVENNYIVNVKDIENIEIFLVNGIKIGDDTYYTDDEIIEKYNDIFAGR